MLMVGMTCDEK